ARCSSRSSAGLEVGGDRDQVPEGVLDERRVLRLLPVAVGVAESPRRECPELPACVRGQRRRAPERERALEQLVRVERGGRRGLENGRTEDAARDVPPGEERGSVEPAVVVPAGDVRRVEELLPGLV